MIFYLIMCPITATVHDLVVTFLARISNTATTGQIFENFLKNTIFGISLPGLSFLNEYNQP